jgi:membrane-associated phospholipid phosphatase
MVRVQTSTDASRRMFAAAAVCAVGFGATWLLFVRTSAGQWLDGAVLPRAERGGGYAQQTMLVGPADLVLGRFGNPLLIGLLVIAIVVAGVLAGRIRAAVAAFVLFACAAGGAGLAKQVIMRPELGVVGSSTHNSFPSGHAAVATALLLSVLLVVPARARVWVAVPGAMGVSVVAAATMVAGWHRFSDVVGSLLLVATLFFVAAAVLNRWPGRTAEPAPNGVAGGGGVALASGGALLMVPLVAVAPDAGVPLVAAIAATIVLTMVVVWAAVRLCQPGAKAQDLDKTKPPRAYVHPGRL